MHSRYVGDLFEFDVLIDSVYGYKILRAGSDTITGGVHTVGASSSFSTAAVSGAQQVDLRGHGTCVEPFATRTCTSFAASSYNNVTTCTETQ